MAYLMGDEDLNTAIIAFKEGEEAGFRGEEQSNPYPESWYTGKCWVTGYKMGCSKRRNEFEDQG